MRPEPKAEELAKQDAPKLAALSAKISLGHRNNPKLAEFSSQQIRSRSRPTACRSRSSTTRTAPCSTSAVRVKPYMRDILREIGRAGRRRQQDQPGRPHRPQPYGSGERGYSNWELSSDRANASRRELVAAGMPDDKVARVHGPGRQHPFAGRDPRRTGQPSHQHHVMTREAEERLLGARKCRRTSLSWRLPSRPAAPAASAASAPQASEASCRRLQCGL
jgi:chemotaxis protein MotB